MKKLIVLLPLLMAMTKEEVKLGVCLTEEKDYGLPPNITEQVIAVGSDGFSTKIVEVKGNSIFSIGDMQRYRFNELPIVRQVPCPKIKEIKE